MNKLSQGLIGGWTQKPYLRVIMFCFFCFCFFFSDPHQRQGESEMGNLIPLNKKMSMMQNFLDLEERLKDLTTDLQKLKEEFASTIAHMDTARTHRQFDDEVPNKKSSFFSLLNGKSNNTETVL